MHHTADPGEKDQAEATRLSYRVARLFMQSMGDSILPGMNAEITDYIQKCDVCMSLQSNQSNQTKQPLSQHQGQLGESCH